MTAAASHRVTFLADSPVDELDEVLGTQATLLDGSDPSRWTVTVRDAAELQGVLDRMRTAGLTLISVDAIE